MRSFSRWSILSLLVLVLTCAGLPIDEKTFDGVEEDRNYPADTTICFDAPIGCFSNVSPFNNALNYLPIPPDMLMTEFLLFTRKNPQMEQLVHYSDERTILNSNLDKNLPLRIVIHGFDNNRSTEWMHTIKNIILKVENVNVILVGWGNGSAFPFYNNATANIRLVGRELGLLVNLIRSTLFSSANDRKNFKVYCIGHSLGAHTCAYASNNAEYRFQRITGMDPAGPFFEDSDPIIRLDPTDADFVDVIHTNGGSLLSASFGITMPCGHVDFFPNGGKTQANCPAGISGVIGGVVGGGLDPSSAAGCSHSRAYELFIESITSSCPFISYNCKSEDDFFKGACTKCPNNRCAVMGYWADKYPGRGSVYLATNGQEPFCGHHHILELFMSSDAARTAGEISVAFPTSNVDNFFKIVSTNDDIFRAGEVFKKVFVTQNDLEQTKLMDLKFIKKPKPLIGTDPNGPTLKFSKVGVYSIDLDEDYSECDVKNVESNTTVKINLSFQNCQINT